MVYRLVSNADKPSLGIRHSGQKMFRCSDNIVCDFKGSGFNVDRYNLAMITFFDLRSPLAQAKLSNLSFIKCIASLGKLFFTIAGLSYCHLFNLSVI
jgi:hypothetical protein